MTDGAFMKFRYLVKFGILMTLLALTATARNT
jgi:hypothetical protein